MPVNTTRSARHSLLATSLGMTSASTRAHSGGLVGVGERIVDTDDVEPSPTASRLRSLARSIHAANKLGSLKVRKRYLASAPMAAAGTASPPIEAGVPSHRGLTGTNPTSTRVIMLPTNEFSTAEMKFRLDPLEPASPAGGWNVHGMLDAVSAHPQSPTAAAHRPSSASHNGVVVKSERSGSTASLLSASGNTSSTTGGNSGSSSTKSRWKTAGSKVGHGNGSGATLGGSSSNNNSVGNNGFAPQSSPTLRRGQSHSAGTKHSKRGSSTNFAPDHTSFLPLAGSASGSAEEALSGNGHSNNVNVEARLCCARSLYKLSCQAGCELSIIHGGAISQLAEVSDVEHLHLHELCAATLANLTAEPSATDAFVAQDGIPALLELSWSPSIAVKLMCATALCRLSRCSPHAAVLARARASIEFMSMMSLPCEQLQKLAISCIVNLIFYGHSFPDRIFLGEPHAIQNQLGILSITNQLAMAPQTMQFAAEVLFNLALYRTSCSGVLRGGGADILHGLAVHVGKALDEHYYTSSSNTLSTQQTPRMSQTSAMVLLRLIAHTLANFSAHGEFQSMTSGSTMKTVTLMLAGALRDLGSRFYGGLAEERLRILAVPCSRALANLSSCEEQRKQGFTPDMVQLTTRLFLVNRHKLFQRGVSSSQEEQTFARNILRAIVNLSFYEPCAAQFMEFAEVMPRLTKVVLKEKNGADGECDESDESEDQASSDDDEYDDDEDEREDKLTKRSNSIKDKYTLESTESHGTGNSQVENEMREDALIAIINLAQQGAYSHELLKHLDGKKLALAAEAQERGSRLKYVYDVVVCNILFESRLQQLMYGDLVVNSLVDGFYFFASSSQTGGATSGGADPFSVDGGSRDAHAFQGENLAFPDDQERFLVALASIAGEVMDPRNIDRLVTLVLDCMRPMDTSMSPTLRKWRRHITGYSSAVLYTLARSSATRGDAGNRIYAPETVQALIDICEGKATAATSGSGTCGEFMTGAPDIETGRSSFYSYCAFAQAFSAATLYHICATGHFNPRVIQALISACNANEETLSLLACSAAFAIISFTPEGRQQLVASQNLAKALNRLGRTSQVECQQYAAIAACNVSTVHCIWSSHELKDFIVVALLRANSLQAKQIHAKTLANLLSHIKTRAKSVDDGVLYALIKLSQVMPPSGAATEPTPSVVGQAAVATDHHNRSPAGSSRAPDPTDEVFLLGLQVLFNLSCERQYHQKLMGNGVIAYLATAILSGKQASPAVGKEHLRGGASALSPSETSGSLPLASTVSTDSRRYAMGIICNLSSYESNHKELMNAQVIDIIRSYVDNDVETRASAAMAVRNLSCRQPWVEMICERRTLQMLISFTHCDHAVVRHFAIQALANCSQVTDSLHLFGELKVTRAVMAVLESIRAPGPTGVTVATNKSKMSSPATNSLADSRETSMAALKCLHNVAFDDALAQNLMDETAILRLQPIMESRELDICEEACMLAATMISVLAGKPRCAEALLRQRVVGFCALLHRKHPNNPLIGRETSLILVKLSTYQPIQAALTETQAIQVVVTICTSSCASRDDRIRECGVIAIRNLTLCVAEHLLVFYDETGFDDEELSPPKAASIKRRRPGTVDRRSASRQSNDVDDSGSHVTRLMERHLMQGVHYFQQEIERSLPGFERGNASQHAGEVHHAALNDRILVEACAGIANLSTVKSFRVEMVRSGVVPTLLRLFRASQDSANLTIPCIVRSICSATLHRLALEEEATVDGQGMLVPSLLKILYQSDEELHQVRYECEKVSFPTSSPAVAAPILKAASIRSGKAGASAGSGASMSCSSQRTSSTTTLTESSSSSSSSSSLPRSPSKMLTPPSSDSTQTALIATTTCVKQTYREPKWITYVVKAMLSSASMVPQIEKQQIRAIGQPKLSFFDMDSSNLFAVHSTAPAPQSQQPPGDVVDGVGDEATAKRKGGYLLPVHMDKFTSHLAACLQDGEPSARDAAGLMGLSVDSFRQQLQLSTGRSSLGGLASARDASSSTHDREALVHSRKFDRHMRLTRRNYRRTNVLPALSFS